MTASSDSTVRQTKTKTGLNSSCYFNGIVFQLFFFTTILLIDTSVAAPLSDDLETSHQSQLSDYYGASPDSMSCYYNFQHYEEGDRIVTNEPCLNCTCHKRMLMCYLRVCPFTKAVGQNCTVEKRPDQCCPIITCPEVPVQLLTSSTTAATPSTQSAVAPPDTFGCMLENAFYPDGAQVPSDPKNPCELCYCIRNRTACVLQECTLNVEGCKPVHQPGVCCPVRYDCDYEEASTSSETAVGTGLLLTTTQSPQQCNYHGQMFNDGELISLMQSEGKSCERCYCMRGEIVCAVQDCGNPLEGKDCEPIPPPSGQCCPTTYMCANETVPVESLSRVSTPPPSVSDLSTTISSTDQETEEPFPSKQTIESDEPVNEDTEADPMKSEEQETADSKQSGTQIIPESEITKVTSVAETHTEISISTKQDEGTEVAVSSDTELTTLKPESEPEKNVDFISGQIDETTQHSSSVSVEMDEEKIAESTEKFVSYTTTVKYHSDLSSEDASSEELHVEMPHPIEIDEPEKTPEERTTVSSEKVDESTPVESDEADQGPLVISDREKDSTELPEETHIETELPEETHIETELPDKHFPTESPVELGVSTDADKIPFRDSTESSSTDKTISSTISPFAEDSNAGASINSETIADKNGIESITMQASVMTNQPEENLEVTPQSAETGAPISSLSNDQDETKDQDKTKDQDEKTTTASIVEENQTTKPDVTEKLPIEPSEQPVEAGHPEEDEPSVVEPIEPQVPELQVENDSVDESEDESEPVLVTDKSPTAETEKPVEEKFKPVAEEEVLPTTSQSVSESESEKTTTTAPVVKVDEDVKVSEHEITTASVVQSKPSEDQTVSFSEILNGESQTTPHTKVESPSAEPTISNEISNDVDHQTSAPPHEEEMQPAVTEQIIVEKGVIPGEGSCLVDGTTYPDGEIVPATNPCHTECKCHSSIIQCNMIDCPPPPPHMKNCMPVQHNDDTCCPMYSCDGEKDHPSLESDNQLGNIDTINNREKEETPVTEDESSGSLLPETVQTVTTTSVPAVDDKPSEGSVIPEKEVSPEGSVTTEKDLIAQVEDKNKPEETGIMPGIVSPQLPGSVEHDEVSSEQSSDEHNISGIDASEITESNAVEPADTEEHITESDHHVVSKDKISTVSPLDSSIVTEKESVAHTDIGEVAVHSDVSDASAHADVSEVGADFNVGEADAHSDTTEGNTHTDVAETGAHADVGEVGPDSDVGEAGAHADVGEVGPDSDVGEAGADSDETEAGVHTDVGEAGTQTDLGEAGAHTDVAEADAHTDLPEAGAHTDVPEIEVHTSVPEAGAHTEVPEAGTYTDIIEAGAHSDVDEAGTHTDVSEAGAHTDVSEVGAHTDVGEVDESTEAVLGPDQEEEHISQQQPVPTSSGSEPVPTTAESIKDSIEHDESHESDHTPEEESSPEQIVHQETTVAALSDVTSIPDTTSKFEEIDIPDSTSVPVVLPQENEHTSTKLSIPSVIEITTEDQSSISSETVDQTVTESALEEDKEKIHELSTTPPTESESGIQSNIEEQIPVTTQSSLKDELESTNNVLGPLSGLPGGAEDGSSSENDQVESQVDIETSPQPDETKFQVDTETSPQPDEIKSQVGTETSPQPDEIKSPVDTETSLQPDEITPKPVDQEIPAEHAASSETIVDREKTEDEEVEHISLNTGIPVVVDTTEAAGDSIEGDKHHKIVTEESGNVITQQPEIYIESEPTLKPQDEISTSEQSPAEEITNEGVDDHQVVHEIPEEPWAVTSEKSETDKHVTEEHTTEPSQLNQEQDGAEKDQEQHELEQHQEQPEHEPEHQEQPEHEPEHQEQPEHEPEHQEQPEHEPEKHQEQPEHEPEKHQEQPEHEPEKHQEQPEHEPEQHQDGHVPEQHEEHGLETTTEQKDHVEGQSLIHDHTSDESTEVASEKIPVETNEEMEGDKKQGIETEATKPSVTEQSSENNESSQPSSEEETKPEEVEIHTTTSSSTQSPFDLTTKFTPLISSEPIGIVAGELPTNTFSHMPMPGWTQKPFRPELTTEASVSEEEQQPFQPSGGDLEYEEEEESSFGPGTCRYGGKVFVSAQQVPRDNPCDFCFCFRGDIICLQQSCPPPIHGCRQESIQGFCCPRYECPVSMANSLNLTTTTTTTTTTLPPHFFSHAAYRGAARRSGCQVQGHAYRVGDEITSASGPCLHCMCGASGQMKCDPKVCSPEPMLRKMIEAAVRRRR